MTNGYGECIGDSSMQAGIHGPILMIWSHCREGNIRRYFESRHIVGGNFLMQPITSCGARLSAGELSATICSERKPPCT